MRIQKNDLKEDVFYVEALGGFIKDIVERCVKGRQILGFYPSLPQKMEANMTKFLLLIRIQHHHSSQMRSGKTSWKKWINGRQWFDGWFGKVNDLIQI